MVEDSKLKVAIVGGTGHLGSALAFCLARAGVRVLIGSRDRQSADRVAANLHPAIESGDNRTVAAEGDIVIVTVPYSAHAATLDTIRSVVAGKIVVDATVPLVPPAVMRVQLPATGSAAIEARALLGENVRLVSAFHNVAAHRLAKGEPVDCDVLVFGDEPDARREVIRLVRRMGMRGIAGGALANSAAAEALTSVLIFLNKTYKADGAGIRLTGLDEALVNA
jgi:8-hydroxy-5-deazaflavin:NADPH oxidoreductase